MRKRERERERKRRERRKVQFKMTDNYKGLEKAHKDRMVDRGKVTNKDIAYSKDSGRN